MIAEAEPPMTGDVTTLVTSFAVVWFSSQKRMWLMRRMSLVEVVVTQVVTK